MGAQQVAERFAELYGARPQGVWAAPGRVNLIGEHTDYNDGFVMPFALPHQALAAVSRRDDGLLRLHSADMAGGVVELRLDALAPGGDPAWTAYPAGVVWALREAGHPVTGADIHLSSTVPTGAGLSSSAALEVVIALALRDLYGLDLARWQLARLCQRAENVYVGAPTGIMDQTAAACCEPGHALFLDTRDLSQRQIPFDLAAEGLRLLVVDTQVKHAHSGGEYGKRRAGCEKGAALLGVTALRDIAYADLDAALARLGEEEEIRRLVRHVVTEDERVERTVALLRAGTPRAIGPILTEGHASLRDDFRISCPELDLVVETALAHGALGARMTGGGFGGSAIVLTDTADVPSLTESLETAFTAAQFKAPRVFEAVPSAGARRLV
ncbi:galactokinase [Streptomyces griseofuscus]|uniref:galactokinase n=1 Tax=Streptomyces TaxID=1883 RepID=UPI00081E076F|nr:MULTISPECIES: galactokinase [unclassified Streptomyces]MBJ7001641.1 galactokinase [Streptomyces sp. CRPSP2-6A1]MYQ95949.1 galactokinase [Streptomyces sp. SID4946]SCF97759.1 galactokinase [Streptomyces sp. LamerLS-31b]SCF98388.1 galactokinase [Streptomyces sp. DconLS]